MSNVFYTPPGSDVGAVEKNGAVFFTVSRTKLIVMMTLTFGLYMIYWNYKNWAAFKLYSGRPIWPLPRAIFAIFYWPSLFCKVNRLLNERKGHGLSFWRTMLVVLYATMFSGFVGEVPIEWILLAYDAMGVWPLLAFAVFLAFAGILVQCIIFLRVQSAINLVNGTPGGQGNSRFTLANVCWMLPGVGLWLLLIFSLLSAVAMFSQLADSPGGL